MSSGWADNAAAIAAVGSGLIALGALALAGLALRENRRSAKAAEDSAAMARISAEASKESVEIAGRALEAAMRVRWKLTKGSDRDWYLLTNEGGTTAHAVRIECESLAYADQPWESIGPGESVRFLATPMFRSDGIDDERVTVLHRLKPERKGDGPVPWRSTLPS